MNSKEPSRQNKTLLAKDNLRGMRGMKRLLKPSAYHYWKTLLDAIFAKQEGKCNGCLIVFPFHSMTINRILLRKEGSAHIDNLQILCNACNYKKDTLSQEEFIDALVRAGFRQTLSSLSK